MAEETPVTPEAPAVGVKELKEVFAGVGLLVKTYKDAMKDGKIDLQDLPVLVNLATESGKLVDAVEGVDKIGDEIKDLDGEEAVELVREIFALIKSVKA